MFRKLLGAIMVLTVIFPAMGYAQTPTVALTAEAQACTAVQDRTPVGAAESFTPDVGQVYVWCKIMGATDPSTVIRHVWYHNGQEKATVELTVKGSNWRTWSSKKIPASWTGDWVVKIVDATGNIIKEVPFKIATK